MSLGQTLFHRYLGHSRFGGRFFKNHIQFHHTHYSGDHVVSTHYLDNGDNNTLFFLMPIAVIVSLSYLFLRLDLLVVQLAAMSLSFCGHYYIDNQYHVAGSWLGRFSWFRRKQQLHFIHHRHGNCNFAVIDFFWDRLLGTYRRVESGGMHCDICYVTATSPNRNVTLRRRANLGCQHAIDACPRTDTGSRKEVMLPDGLDRSSKRMLLFFCELTPPRSD